MNTIAILVREALSEKYPTPGKGMTEILGIKRQNASNKLCGRIPITLRELAKLDRALDLDAESLKRAISNYKWGEEADESKPT